MRPEDIFDRAWAITLLRQALDDLQRWCIENEKAERFDVLKGFLQDEATGSYGEAARELGVTEDVVKQEVRRLRKRCGTMIRRRITDTLAGQEDVEDELQSLFRSLEKK
jgi:RNA polymerase sigma-70 factor (ECF subfamily)